MKTMGHRDVVDIDYDGVEKPAETQTSIQLASHSMNPAPSSATIQ